MAAAGSSTVQGTHFHPQHTLTAYHYSEASTYHCAACELVVTGVGYSCDGCGFDIHGECLRAFEAAGRISFSLHPAHALTLTCLAAAGGGHCCGVCERASPAGDYMYICEPCGYGVHPMCVVKVVSQQASQQRRGRGRRAMHTVGYTAHTVHRLVDLVITLAQVGACTIM
ncbi:hypothetical protein HU200_051903 [Digitaria exilis]|uniref:Phorbol-ester/DAG-type domain-containing protein n=1 Tax=Digitaria exilis TaxID=1010633 RepID=A0A835AJU0_9POAL|nr:hypothetical protein HU200_051903 [Digitaria exilis]